MLLLHYISLGDIVHYTALHYVYDNYISSLHHDFTDKSDDELKLKLPDSVHNIQN